MQNGALCNEQCYGSTRCYHDHLVTMTRSIIIQLNKNIFSFLSYIHISFIHYFHSLFRLLINLLRLALHFGFPYLPTSLHYSISTKGVFFAVTAFILSAFTLIFYLRSRKAYSFVIVLLAFTPCVYFLHTPLHSYLLLFTSLSLSKGSISSSSFDLTNKLYTAISCTKNIVYSPCKDLIF